LPERRTVEESEQLSRRICDQVRSFAELVHEEVDQLDPVGRFLGAMESLLDERLQIARKDLRLVCLVNVVDHGPKVVVRRQAVLESSC
jgi:hypothetical protein